VHFRVEGTVKNDVHQGKSVYATKVFCGGTETDCCPLTHLVRHNQGAFFGAKETWGDSMDFAGHKRDRDIADLFILSLRQLKRTLDTATASFGRE
jgi:hypothetical protein